MNKCGVKGGREKEEIRQRLSPVSMETVGSPWVSNTWPTSEEGLDTLKREGGGNGS